MPDIGDVEIARLNVDPGDGTTVGALTVHRPDGTTDTPAVTPTVNGDGTVDLAATVTYTISGWWLLSWSVSGMGAGVQSQQVFVSADPAVPPAEMVYASEEELREQFGDEGGTLPTVLLQRALKASARAIDSWCGRRFWQDPTATVRTYLPTTSRLAFVDDISTSTGLLVAVDVGLDGTFAESWILGVDYALQPSNAEVDGKPWTQIVSLGGREFPLSDGRDTLRVTGRHGWAAIPDGANEANILHGAALFKRRESVDGIRGFGDFGVVRISTRRDPDVVELLAPLRRGDRMVA